MWLVVVHFACPVISSIPHCCAVSTFHHPSQSVLKMEHFPYVSVENHMWKCGQEGFFHLTYGERKHQSNSHNQNGANDFQSLIWIFSVCWLSPTWYNVDCSQLLFWFDHYQLQLVYQIMEQHPARNPRHETSQTTLDKFDLLHTLHISFCVFQLRFTLLKIIKHSMPKMLLFFFYIQY